MATITYQDLQKLLNMTTAAENCEAIIDHAINKLNAYGADLPNMMGTAGSKTWSGESREKGAIMELACDIYTTKYLTSGSTSSSISVGGLSSSTSTSTAADATTEKKAMELARKLVEPEVSLG